MRAFDKARKKLMHKIVHAKPMQQPELCKNCIWRSHETEKYTCMFASCVVCKGWPRQQKY